MSKPKEKVRKVFGRIKDEHWRILWDERLDTGKKIQVMVSEAVEDYVKKIKKKQSA
jgi:hypothetical protein